MNQDLFLAFTLALLIGSLNAYLAKGWGRSPLIWFFIGAFFGLLGLIALFLLPAIVESEPKKLWQLDQANLIKPLPPLASSWYYLDAKHTQAGPIALLDLERVYKMKTVTASTYLWCEGMPEWKKLEHIATLESYLSHRSESGAGPA